ncbi:MAG TPA: NifU N-terminal domain-containing protein [Phycisphaerales bacterium]|nr:NifU N-terminal domain-containing protein [Phycisphaerales bacterium]
MSHSIVEFQTTPNPNALKCILDRPLAPASIASSERPALRSFRSAGEAASDPLARALLGVAGLTSVLIADGWITINKSPAAAWPSIKKEVQRVLAGAAG